MELGETISQLALGENGINIQKKFHPLQDFDIRTSTSGEQDFDVLAFDKEKKFGGHCKFTRIGLSDTSPKDLNELLHNATAKGIDTYLDNVAVETKYQGSGVGITLWELGLTKLLSRSNGPIMELISDDSSPKGWTEKHIPELILHAAQIGYSAEIVWTGNIESEYSTNKSWLILYRKGF
ncbi:MAG: hypothetical protein ACD_48C00693G0002 [uncultured bacterium]|nr:MAG: hypothetical protein ACD_48C00693G0002 [uncultured bacterium]